VIRSFSKPNSSPGAEAVVQANQTYIDVLSDVLRLGERGAVKVTLREPMNRWSYSTTGLEFGFASNWSVGRRPGLFVQPYSRS
jgi:hypothetical protein